MQCGEESRWEVSKLRRLQRHTKQWLTEGRARRRNSGTEFAQGVCADPPEPTKNLGMKRDDTNWDHTNSLRTGSAVLSRMLLAIRRLAALTRSPVPIEWESNAQSQLKAKFQNLGRWMLNVVGCWSLVVRTCRLEVRQLECSHHARPARFPLTSHYAGPCSCISRRKPYGRIRGTARF